MQDLASEFQDDFLEAVKVLEDFSSSDGDLREAMREIRKRIAAKKYVCAPNFWDDLRGTLKAVEQQRDERAAKSKAQQVLKQIARLEVRFWAKESVGMLRELDPESRLERMVDWIQTFSAMESADQSSGPAVLYQVLNDIGLQKDMEQPQREALSAAVRDSLHKFPVEMQAVLERVGSLQSGGGTARVLSDWRRRNQPAAQEQTGGGTRLTFVPATAPHLIAMPGHLGSSLGAAMAGGDPSGSAGSLSAAIDGTPLTAAALPSLVGAGADAPGAGDPALARAGAEDEAQAEDDEAAGFEPFNVAEVDPELLERARRAVLGLLESNSGECQKQYVRTLLKQLGVSGLPIAALGAEVFFSATEVFTRRVGAPLPPAAQPAKSPVPEELRHQMTALVREAGDRLTVAQLTERLQWHVGSIRHNMHGPLRRAIAQVPELLFEPKKVFTAAAAKRHVAVLGDGEDEAPAEPAADATPAAAPYVADPFAELLATIMAWLQQGNGVVSQEAVLPLIKALGFKTRAVITALSRDVFWSHPESDCQILLRTAAGAAQHPRPLAKVYLNHVVHQNLIAEVKGMGPKAKMDKLAGILGWNARSELRRAYGALRIVMAGLREMFYDPNALYLKRALDGLVEWPVSKDGRLGPQAGEESVVQSWTPAVDDLKGAGDPEWMSVKRQLLGTLMNHGGRCEASLLRQLLHPLDGVELEELVQPGSARDLSKVLFWATDRVYRRRTEAIDAWVLTDDQVSAEVRRVVVDAAKAQGSVSLAELKQMLADATPPVSIEDEALFSAVQSIAEVFFMPEVVFLRHVADSLMVDGPEEPVADPGQPAGVPAAAEQPAADGQVSAGHPVAVEEQDSADVEEALLSLKAAVADADASAGAAIGPSVADAPLAAGQEEGASESTSAGVKFFSFDEFMTAHGAPRGIERPPAKRQRLEEAGDAAAGLPDVWSAEAPPWATEGAAVIVRGEEGKTSLDGVIVRAAGTSCTVRVVLGDPAGTAGHGGVAGGGLAVERDYPTPALIPVSPTVGATVKVVAGDRCGLTGTLVGLAGGDGVVQIGKMMYETLRMNQFAVLAV